jgi:hypothetical protein
MLLMPIGIINERHEPPVFNGLNDPSSTPSSCRPLGSMSAPVFMVSSGAASDTGVRRGSAQFAGVQRRGGHSWRPTEGVPGQRAQRRIRARTEYLGLRHLTLGASVWSGESSFATPRLDTSVTVGELDARYRRDRLELRGQFAQVRIADAARLNDSLGRAVGVSPNIAEALRGFYGEAAYRVWNAGAPRDLVAFFRYENFDTQFRMPKGFLPLKEFDRDAWVTGVTYYPDPDVAVKADLHLPSESERHLRKSPSDSTLVLAGGSEERPCSFD